MARVLIGIPTRNRPQYFRDTLASVLAQEGVDLRVVVSDNASTPAAAADVAQHIAQLGDPRVTHYLQPKDIKEYGQGHFLFAQCEEEYFMIVHDDDVLDPALLRKGIAALDADPALALAVANPHLMDAQGVRSPQETAQYLVDHGRSAQPAGAFSVLTTHLHHGFSPISGTLLRAQHVRDAGFVDADCFGCFPFEFNLFLRLGAHGARGWFLPETLLSFRFHDNSLRSTLGLWQNPHVVGTMIMLLERHRFTGRDERRRLALLAWLMTCMAKIEHRRGASKTSRRLMLRALATDPRSKRNWVVAPLGILRSLFPSARSTGS